MNIDQPDFQKAHIPLILSYDYESIRVQKYLDSLEFESAEAYQEFIDKEVVGKTPEEILNKFKVEKTNYDLANEIVMRAWDADIREANKLIKTALKLDPENLEAKLFKASQAHNSLLELTILIEAVETEEMRLGETYFEKYTGYFWEQPESQPFMFAKLQLVECYLTNGEIDAAIDEMEDMLELNTNDNQGVRDKLAPYYICLRKFGAYKKLRNIYKKDHSVISYYTWFCYLFYTEGASKKTMKAFEEAAQRNPFVFNHLIGKTELTIPDELPELYVEGEESEALYCLLTILPMLVANKELMKFLTYLKESYTKHGDRNMRVVR